MKVPWASFLCTGLQFQKSVLCFSQLAVLKQITSVHNLEKIFDHYNYVMACLGPCRHRTVHLIIIIHAYRREKTENVYSYEYYDDHEKILRMKIISIPQFYLVWCVAVQFWRCQSSHQKDHHSYKYLKVHTENKLGLLSRDTIVNLELICCKQCMMCIKHGYHT